MPAVHPRPQPTITRAAYQMFSHIALWRLLRCTGEVTSGSSFPVTGASLPRLLYPRIAVELVALPNLSASGQGWMFGARFALSR
jgi:hypothetical protein